MTEKQLNWLSKKGRAFLIRHVKRMPMRWKKFIAYYYTDAVVRKLYWKELHVHMGEGSFANLGMLSDATRKAPVIIGRNVSIAPHVTFITASSPNNGVEIKQLKEVKERLIKEKKIVVEDEVWIGANVTILPGVRIGRCSIIGAGAVVIRDVEPYSIYVGIPAKKLRVLEHENACSF